MVIRPAKDYQHRFYCVGAMLPYNTKTSRRSSRMGYRAWTLRWVQNEGSTEENTRIKDAAI
ncbi:hypothetical protein U1Q18_049322, partial [Sarracenia purpurea var. burkii]